MIPDSVLQASPPRTLRELHDRLAAACCDSRQRDALKNSVPEMPRLDNAACVLLHRSLGIMVEEDVAALKNWLCSQPPFPSQAEAWDLPLPEVVCLLSPPAPPAIELIPGGFSYRGKSHNLTGRPRAMLEALLAAKG